MCEKNAKAAYKDSKDDIANLLGWFECELAKTPTNINWENVGTLNKVKENLIETLSFLSGFEIETIKENLEESRIGG